MQRGVERWGAGQRCARRAGTGFSQWNQEMPLVVPSVARKRRCLRTSGTVQRVHAGRQLMRYSSEDRQYATEGRVQRLKVSWWTAMTRNGGSSI